MLLLGGAGLRLAQALPGEAARCSMSCTLDVWTADAFEHADALIYVGAAGIAVRCTKQLTGANGRSLVEESEAGYVKLVCDEATGRVLGAQLVCPRATDLVAEVALAIHLGATAADVAATIHPHPTVSEMIMEAAR